ncbi:hypothetical protein HELRODRAFT_172663 [Helobdella robusta]|uniref:Protein kinase domain-containing protein n=1 Tax=Helobdella robusta TaxID=6412 RepID=T1F5R4_HELRO|nr:hypothetical protein HELRODRAFT_172663 [Helobdella robusta]ESO04307.1 hypothetical protein HELRODRAFT_172663 [Helobdella robusta]
MILIVEHYHIDNKDGKLTIDEEAHFDDLTALIMHYQRDSDGLVCQLGRALPRTQHQSTEEFFTRSLWNFNLSDITLGEQIGKGEYGEVYRGTLNGEDVAIKVIKGTMVHTFLQEASVMTTLKHKNLVHLKGVVMGTPTYIMMELLLKGSLVDYLRTRGRSVISPADQIKFSSRNKIVIIYNCIIIIYNIMHENNQKRKKWDTDLSNQIKASQQHEMRNYC